MIRSLRTAVRVPGEPPFDTAHLTVLYPAAPTGSDVERLSGVIPVDRAGAPYPVVLFLPGVNVPSASYRWLGERMAAAGIVFATFDLIAPLFGDAVGLTPGLDLGAVTPGTYGTRPPGSALRPILDTIAVLGTDGLLAGALRPGVVLAGHSAGGTVALESADPEWFPEIAAVVTYGAHTMAASALGWDDGTVLPSPATCPVLLVAGSADGVMAASSDRYGGDRAHDPVTRTHREALGRSVDPRLEVLEGATHMALVHPEDPTTGRGFLDNPSEADPSARDAFVRLLADVTHSVPLEATP